MKIKTSELEGEPLDWAVADALGWMCGGNALEYIEDPEIVVIHTCTDLDYEFESEEFSPSRIWSQGGPLVELYKIGLLEPRETEDYWTAWTGQYRSPMVDGPTPLVAACRAIVAAKLGDEVEIPDELA